MPLTLADIDCPGWWPKSWQSAGDEEDWRAWARKGDPVTHVELRKWADCLLVAPLSANTLAKIAQV